VKHKFCFFLRFKFIETPYTTEGDLMRIRKKPKILRETKPTQRAERAPEWVQRMREREAVKTRIKMSPESREKVARETMQRVDQIDKEIANLQGFASKVREQKETARLQGRMEAYERYATLEKEIEERIKGMTDTLEKEREILFQSTTSGTPSLQSRTFQRAIEKELGGRIAFVPEPGMTREEVEKEIRNLKQMIQGDKRALTTAKDKRVIEALEKDIEIIEERMNALKSALEKGLPEKEAKI